MNRISFVTTCKGRLHHLKETLPLWLEQGPDEVVVVDYGCPDGTAAWLAASFPQVKVVRVTDDPGFNASRARNFGGRAATSPWLCFIDADIRIAPGWLDWLREHLDAHCFYLPSEDGGVIDVESSGTVLCTRQAFDAVGGYDEVMSGWGAEDSDFYRRLRLKYVGQAAYPRQFVLPIRHGEDERFRFRELRNKGLSIVVGELYAQAKSMIMWTQGGRTELPFDVRASLMEEVRRQVLAWEGDPAKALPSVSLRVGGESWLPEPFRLSRQVTFTLAVENRSGTPPASAPPAQDPSGGRPDSSASK